MPGDAPTDPRPPLSEAQTAAHVRRREALHRAVMELDGELDVLAQAAVVDAERLAQALRDTLATLEQHVEEADAPEGLLGQILEVAPWFGPRVEKLREEHHGLRERATMLLAQVEESEEPARALPAARELSGCIAGHRHRGTALLLDAYLLDIPQGD